MGDVEGFVVKSETITDGYILKPVGDVDLSRSPVLRTEIADMQTRHPNRLVIDLTEVPYMDSSGVATLVEAMQVARKVGSKLVLCGMQNKVKAIFEIARLDMVFTIAENKETALTI